MRIPLAGHLGTKLMALILGIALWGFAFMQNLKDATINYRVRFDVPEGMAAEPAEKLVTVRVRGPRRIVDAIKRDEVVEKQIDGALAETEDSKLISVTTLPEDLGGGTGLIYLEMPDPIQVEVTRYTTKSMAVDLQTTGSPLEGYVLSKEQTRIRPAMVEVTGPKRLLEGVESISTKQMNLASRYYANETLPVDIEATINGKAVRVKPQRVEVTLVFDRKPVTRTFESVPVSVMQPPGWPYAAKTDPAVASVTVEGPEAMVATLEQSSIAVYVEMVADDTPRATGYSKPARAIVPRDVTWKVSPENISVEVSVPQP